MKQELKKHISKNLPFLKGEKILIAISGGIDSVVLTHLFHSLKYEVGLAHCNFSLRGKESNKDEAFVKTLGNQLEFPTHTIKFDTNQYAAEKSLSTQMAARELRYNYFQSLCEEHGYAYVLTAHHQDDALETFLINLTRGTGLEGLTGIPEVNGNIVRPLLPFNQNDILLHATKHKLSWREDESNSSLKYMRNRIRQKVIPVLKELNPSLLDSFSSTVKHLKGSQAIVSESIEKVKSECFKVNEKDNTVHLEIDKLNTLNNRDVYLYELLKDFGFTAWDDISDLLSAQTGKKVFSKTHVLLKNRNELILGEISAEDAQNFFISKKDKNLETPINLEFKKIELDNGTFPKAKNSNEIFVDADTLQYPLELRKRQKGDYFFPLGMQGKKKVSKYYKDEKFSAIDKENTWILCSGNDIVWIVNHRMDDRFKISKNTKKVLRIKS